MSLLPSQVPRPPIATPPPDGSKHAYWTDPAVRDAFVAQGFQEETVDYCYVWDPAIYASCLPTCPGTGFGNLYQMRLDRSGTRFPSPSPHPHHWPFTKSF